MAALDLFTPIVEESRIHPNFKLSVGRPEHEAERRVLANWADGFIDRDGKFVKEFQTTFNASFWELYLHAAFREVGYTADYTKHAPDFVLKSGAVEFCAEAGVASNPEGYTPEWGWRELLAQLGEPREGAVEAMLELATIRLANTIVTKHRKYLDSYSGLDWVKGKPFVLCVAPFEQPMFWEQNDHALRRVLYGFDQPLYTDSEKGRTILGESRVERATKESGAEVPLEIFTRPEFKAISAVIFSSTATWGKVRALAGAGPVDEEVIFRATRFNPGGLQPRVIVAKRPDYTESLLDGLHVCLNPLAELPFDPSAFDEFEVAIHFMEPKTKSYYVDSPEGFLIHRFLMSAKIAEKFEPQRTEPPPSKPYKRHTVRPWLEGQLINVGGHSGPFDQNHMAHYRGWTVVIAHCMIDNDWGGQAIEALCQSLPTFLARNKGGGIRSLVGEFCPTKEEAFDVIKSHIDALMTGK